MATSLQWDMFHRRSFPRPKTASRANGSHRPRDRPPSASASGYSALPVGSGALGAVAVRSGTCCQQCLHEQATLLFGAGERTLPEHAIGAGLC